MINKERLQELINEGATIVHVYYDAREDWHCERFDEIKLNPQKHYISENKRHRLKLVSKEKDIRKGYLNNLFETEEDYGKYIEYLNSLIKKEIDELFLKKGNKNDK